MHDIRAIRNDPKAFDAAIARRGLPPVSAQIIEVDEQRRLKATELQTTQNHRNEISKVIGQAMSKGDIEEAEKLKAEVATIKLTLSKIEEEERALGKQLEEILAALPNLPADDVPEGDDESQNVLISSWGDKPNFNFEPRQHADIGPALGMDFQIGSKISGARFVFLRDSMARLHRALGQFMLDQQVHGFGYTECNPPLLVTDKAMYGTDKLPKFASDSFVTTNDLWLIPTSEVSLTASVMDDILDLTSLPIRLTALTPCFRSEAGAAGKDTRGLIRQHQFEKCELVSVVAPEDSEAEHERMTKAAENILQKLSLPYRKMLLCTGDMGFGARKTYDLEVWLPGQSAYREISSCSNTGDFQARRLKARYRRNGEKNTDFVHTLNGSGLAVGRTLVAIIENYQEADGSVTIPEVLRSYMGNIVKLEPLK